MVRLCVSAIARQFLTSGIHKSFRKNEAIALCTAAAAAAVSFLFSVPSILAH